MDKHFRFVNRCQDYMNEIGIDLIGFRQFEHDFTNNSFNLLSYIKEIFDKWNRDLEKIILTFDQDNLEDENRNVGKAL